MNIIFSKSVKNLSKNYLEKAAIVNGKLAQTAFNINKKFISESFKPNNVLK